MLSERLHRRASAFPPPRAELTPRSLLQVFKAYCAKKAVSEDGVRFLFDGARLTKQQTPEELDSASPLRWPGSVRSAYD